MAEKGDSTAERPGPVLGAPAAEDLLRYFDLAVDEVKSMVLPPSHPQYLSDAQLVVGAIHTLRNDASAATEAMNIYWDAKLLEWTIGEEMDRSPFNPGNAEAAANKAFWELAAGQALALSLTLS